VGGITSKMWMVRYACVQLLSACTEKLRLSKAARRLFLNTGREVTSDEDLDRDAEVYVSTGEPFRNPVKDMLRMHSCLSMRFSRLPHELFPDRSRPAHVILPCTNGSCAITFL